ncbi:MAG TPA: FtsW/RodA/SpoVE family cell cycle protein, partial [Methanospirillum sp.]|uniref:FtsW/RodA/SpoVE family cell cycle protein n=1 Tax=Methanospirillum sp. TaxID=45200 RepID=UPI002C04A5E6
NGARNYLNIGGLFISLTPVMLLYIPLFGGVLYSYRGKGYGTLWQLILWAGVPIWITFKIPSVMTSAILLFSMAALFSFAVAKGWYQVSRRWTLIVMWSVLILAPIVRISVVFLSGAPSYQVDRLMSWITRDEQMNYTANRLREIIMNSSFVGKNEIARQIVSQKLPDVNADYVLAGIMSMYGVAVAGIVIALLIGLIYKIFHISLRQKNQLGMMIGLGCGMVFLMQTITNVMVIFNLLPMTGIVLPLFSHGGTGIAVSYILLGIVLSIYRYKDISCERKIAKGYL